MKTSAELFGMTSPEDEEESGSGRMLTSAEMFNPDREEYLVARRPQARPGETSEDTVLYSNIEDVPEDIVAKALSDVPTSPDDPQYNEVLGARNLIAGRRKEVLPANDEGAITKIHDAALTEAMHMLENPLFTGDFIREGVYSLTGHDDSVLGYTNAVIAEIPATTVEAADFALRGLGAIWEGTFGALEQSFVEMGFDEQHARQLRDSFELPAILSGTGVLGIAATPRTATSLINYNKGAKSLFENSVYGETITKSSTTVAEVSMKPAVITTNKNGTQSLHMLDKDGNLPKEAQMDALLFERGFIDKSRHFISEEEVLAKAEKSMVAAEAKIESEIYKGSETSKATPDTLEAEEIVAEIRAAGKELINEVVGPRDPRDVAIEFVSERWPRIVALLDIEKVPVSSLPKNVHPDSISIFIPYKPEQVAKTGKMGKAQLFLKTKEAPGKSTTVSEQINSIAHEIGHAVDMNRKGREFVRQAPKYFEMSYNEWKVLPQEQRPIGFGAAAEKRFEGMSQAQIEAELSSRRPPPGHTKLSEYDPLVQGIHGMIDTKNLDAALSKSAILTAEAIIKEMGFALSPYRSTVRQLVEALQSERIDDTRLATIITHAGRAPGNEFRMSPEKFMEELGPLMTDKASDAGRFLGMLSAAKKRIQSSAGKDVVNDAMAGVNEVQGPNPSNFLNIFSSLRPNVTGSPYLDKLLAGPQIAAKLWRGMLVTQLATHIRNFEVQVGRVGLDVLSRGMEIGIQRMFNVKGTATGSPIDAMNEFNRIFVPSNIKATTKLVDAVFADTRFAKQHDRMFMSWSSDVERMTRKEGTVLAGADQMVQFFNTPNRFQEFLIRKGVFAATLEQKLSARGMSLETLVNTNNVGAIPKDMLKASADEALKVTFAESFEGNQLATGIMSVINSRGGAWLGLPFAVPFPRFMMNAIKFQFEFSPLGPLRMLNKSERAKWAAGDRRAMTDTLIGSAMLMAAYQMRMSDSAGPEWYAFKAPDWVPKIGGRMVDLRPFNPFVAQLFIADVIVRSQNGTLDELSWSRDVMPALAGIATRAPGTNMWLYDKLIGSWENEEDWERFKNSFKEKTGRIVAGYFTMLSTPRDIVAGLGDYFGEFGEKMKSLAEIKDTGESFIDPIKAQLRVLGVKQNEPIISPMQTKTPIREHTLLRQVTGITVMQERTPGAQLLAELGIKQNEVLPRTHLNEWNRLMAASMNEPLERAMNRYAKNKDFLAMSRHKQQYFISKEIFMLRERAKENVAAQRPDLKQRLKWEGKSKRFRRLYHDEIEQRGTPEAQARFKEVIQAR